MKGISIAAIPYKSTTLKDGSNPIVLRVTKNRLRKYFSLDLSANSSQWNEEYFQFKKDKRINPDYEKNNAFITSQLIKAQDIIDDFERNKIDWTLNQFEEAFLNRSKQGKVKHFFDNQIQKLKETNHIGNALCYQRTLDMLEIFDKKFDKKLFTEIDIKYVGLLTHFFKCLVSLFIQVKRETKELYKERGIQATLG